MKKKYFITIVAITTVSFCFAAQDNVVIYGETPAKPEQTSAQQQPPAIQTPASPSNTSAQQPSTAGKTHTVAEGDTLWSISKKYNVSVEAIQARNHLSSDVLLTFGQVLQIPENSSNPITNYIPSTPKNPVPEPPSTASETVSSKKESQAPTQNSAASTPSFAMRMLNEARKLASMGLNYNESWKPSGARKSLVMDCSNTSRYLYWRVAGIDIGRTASDQYHFLRLKKKAWEVPSDDSGKPSLEYLRKTLRPGDLLFWEHTYKPQRDPPITHVTVYLGKDNKGEWIMAGSQQNALTPEGKRRSGPAIYIFEPQRPNGGYRTFLGLKHVRGRFVAIGRPLGSN